MILRIMECKFLSFSQIDFDGFSVRSNISLYSVHLLRYITLVICSHKVFFDTNLFSNLHSNYTREQAELLFTVLANTRSTAGIANAITQELNTLPLNLLSDPERYGMMFKIIVFILALLSSLHGTIILLTLQMGARPGLIKLLKGLAYTSAGMNQR